MEDSGEREAPTYGVALDVGKRERERGHEVAYHTGTPILEGVAGASESRGAAGN
jgi:hypothetical protein